ncbi:hypothetical protein AcV5_001377 [Taiwanofungus camphoratus]|nr:hypothetical protein AcV5_001377 [Antrodia cinnamomea]
MPDRPSRSSSGVDRTYSAVLQHCVAKLNVNSQLTGITLAHVLSGDTCSPIGLSDFEAYLARKEYTVENLQFVVWFQDYRRRFFALPDEIQASSPGPKSFTFAVPSAARTTARIDNSKRQADALRHGAGAPMMADPSSPVSASFPRSHSGHLSAPDSPLVQQSFPASRGPGLAQAGEQPFREECMRIVATFLRPGAAKELPLDPALRDAVIRDLTWNTHPDIFLPIYEEMCDVLERTSLPRFLAAATANINLPKQLYWYAVGLVDTLVGVVIAVALITTLPAPPQASRSWRLFAVPFSALGAMQIYSAWRGFCSQVWGRGNTQLRVWEMQEMDEEAAAHWERVLMPDNADIKRDSFKAEIQMSERAPWDSQPDIVGARAAPPSSPSSPRRDEMSAIAPFAACDGVRDTPRDARRPAPSATDRPGLPLSRADSNGKFTRPFVRRSRTLHPCPSPHSKEGSGGGASVSTSRSSQAESAYRRPPVFGPERVVLDPRIQAVHQRVMRDIVHVGFWWTICFTAIILAVPALHR